MIVRSLTCIVYKLNFLWILKKKEEMPFITRNVHYKSWIIFRHSFALTLIAITRYLGNWRDLEIYSNALIRLTKINLRGRCSPFFFSSFAIASFLQWKKLLERNLVTFTGHFCTTIRSILRNHKGVPRCRALRGGMHRGH